MLAASLLNKLAIERLPTLDGLDGLFNTQRIDYPWHDAVLNLQRAVLSRLFNPVTLARIQDNELRFAPNETPFTMADLFNGLDHAIWSELDSGATKISILVVTPAGAALALPAVYQYVMQIVAQVKQIQAVQSS